MSPVHVAIEQLAPATTCLVVGSGPGGKGGAERFYAELDGAMRLSPRHDIMAVNFAACFIAAPLRHLVSLHRGMPGDLRAARRCASYCAGHGEPPITHGIQPAEGVDVVWPDWNTDEGRSGTSGLFAVRVALGLCYARVILVGMPLDGSGHFYDPPSLLTHPEHVADFNVPSVRGPWERAAKSWFEGRVRSMGGWTEQLLGRPDAAWVTPR